MSVTLINIFEVPAGDEDEFIAAWEKTRDYLKTFPAHIETALHQSLHPSVSGSGETPGATVTGGT